MLSIRVKNWCICSGYASIPDAYAQQAHQFLTRTLSEHLCSTCFEGTFLNLEFLMLMLSIGVRNWCVCSGYTTVPDTYAQRIYQFLTHMLRMFWRDLFKIGALSAHISSWCVCLVHALVPDAYAQCTHQFLTHMLRVYKTNIWKMWAYAYGQDVNQFLTQMLSVCISSWLVCSAYT